jgi:GNAT superfamily N-acetyltransferase
VPICLAVARRAELDYRAVAMQTKTLSHSLFQYAYRMARIYVQHHPERGWGPNDVWAAHDEENPGAAVGSLTISHDESGPYIGAISVHPDYQRRGVATQLWEAAGKPPHSPAWNRTSEGDAWAKAVGGPSRETAH